VNIIRRIFRRHAKAKREVIEAQEAHERIEAQWPEVHELSTWARETRERNHLTALFIDSLHGGKP